MSYKISDICYISLIIILTAAFPIYLIMNSIPITKQETHIKFTNITISEKYIVQDIEFDYHAYYGYIVSDQGDVYIVDGNMIGDIRNGKTYSIIYKTYPSIKNGLYINEITAYNITK